MTELFAGVAEQRRGEWRPTHVIELICLTIGILCLSWFGWNWVATEVDQRWANHQLQAALEQRQAAEPRDALAPQVRVRTVPNPGPRPRILPGGLIGRVEVPRLNIAAVVRSGVDDKTLKRAVGHVPDTALPGELGNVGIAAHRDTFFRNLRGVRIGDTIRMVTPAGTYEYRVDSLKIVWPTNVEVLDPTPEPSLTLVTCFPFDYVGSAPKRFIVRAKQMQRETESEKSF